MTTVPTPPTPNYLDDGGLPYSPTGTGVRMGYGRVAGSAASFYIGADATAWNGVVVLNVTGLATAGGQTYTLSIQGSTDDTFAAPVTLGSIQIAAVGQYLVPVYAYSGGVLYPYMRLEKMVTGASASITLNAFPLPFSGLSSLSLQDATAVFGLAAQNTQAIAASIIAWASGTVNGGPNSDGRYPIYDAAGDSVLVLCPAASAALATTSGGGSSGSGGGTTTTTVTGLVKAGLQETFDQAIARLGFTTHTDYLFGTSAIAGAGQTAITNQTQLAALYNPMQDYTGLTKIGEEQERYQPFNATNHHFLTDRLNLTAVLDTSTYAGGYTTVVSQNNTYNSAGVTPYGTPQPPGATNIAPTATTPNSIPIANLGWADTSHVQLGQLVYLQYMGMYYISELVEDTSVVLTLLSSTPYQTTLYANLNVVMPYFACPLTTVLLSSSGTVTTMFNFSQNLPAGVEVGQIFTWANGGNANQATNDLRVVSFTSTSVTVTNGVLYTGIPAGSIGIFGPPITSGQLWSKEHFDFSGAETPAWAFDWYVQLPTDSVGGADSRNITTLSGTPPAGAAYTMATIPTDFPWGAWPALWFYSAADGDTLGQDDTSEIDVHEGFYGTAYGPWVLVGTDHPGSGNPTIQNVEAVQLFLRQGRSSGYSLVGGGAIACRSSLNTLDPSLDGLVRISIIVTPTDTYRYVNGVLLKWDQFIWTSVDHAQMGMDMAVGSFGNYNLLLCLNLAGLANMKFGISRVIVRKI